ncbi:MAG: PTS sugar transporter subunit IIB [Elusimicrobia bacterium]|nr:PTS sugar transporter subunit IIB [Elusimicrobiota bacterium]
MRIDDRLVHGQVVEGWIPFLRANAVMIVSDEAAADETQQALMRMALPESVELEILPVGRAARHAAWSPSDPRRLLVLAPGPKEVLSLLEHGARFSRVNVGGLHYTAGRVQLGRAIFLGEQDMDALRKISERGVRLEGRALPAEKELDILQMIG